jgi:outer membrane receptor protein involved in Fe transport
MTLKKIFSSALLLMLIGISTFVSAQTINGNITGTVLDQQGAAIPNATVTATNTETGSQRSVSTNEEGRFSINALTIGNYSVRVEAASFGASVSDRVQVNTSENTELNISLSPGSLEARVDITADGELLDATQSQVSKVVDQQKILELPGRNSLNGLALLNPGVLPNQNGRPGSGFAVNGNRTRSNNFTIDGANNNDQSLSIPRQNLPPEAIQQFQIITNTFAAEFGRNAGSYVNQITRSGTNTFSGAAFYDYAGNSLNALTTGQERTFRANRAAGLDEYTALRRARNVTVDNTYGFTLGGPIVKNHTFFFTSLDFNDFRSTVGSVSRGALNQESRDRLIAFRNANPNTANSINFLLATFPVANDPTVSGTASVTGLAGGPLVFTTFNPTQGQGIAYGTDFNRLLGKINTRINKNDNLSFRYLVDTFADPGAPASLPGLRIGSKSRNDSFTVNDVYSLRSNLINEFRFTYSYRKLAFPEDFANFVNGAQLFVAGIPGGAFSGGNANFPQGRKDNVYEFTDNVTYTTGDHNFKVGYNLLRYGLNSTFAPNSRGFIQYSTLNDFLTDTNAFIQNANGDFNVNAITYENSAFAQDDWRISDDLTLNLGLRYEYVTTPFGFFSNATSDVNNFAPRIGAAYNPKNFLDGKLVLRGGFGIAYDQVFQNVLLNVSRNFPRVVNNTIPSCNGCAPFLGFGNIPTTATAAGLTTPGAVRAFFARTPQNVDPAIVPFIDARLFSPNERIKQPQSMQWTGSLQYQLGGNYVFKAEYIGTKGSNLIRETEQNYSFSNPALAASINRAPNQRLDPTRGSILVGQGIANSIYHSGQFTFERRLSDLNVFGSNFGQFTFNANYTYSSFISESDDVLGGQLNRTITSDPRNPSIDRARSGLDQPHRFVFSGVFVSPEVFKGNGFLNRLFSGYQISTVMTAASGTPFSILNAANAAGIGSSQISTVNFSQRVGLNNPNGARNSFTTATVVNGVVTSLGANPDARYVIFPAGSGIFGNLGANTERTPSTFNTNVALVKNIRTFTERQRLQLRAEIFNAFNRRNFTIIPTNTLSPGATNSNFLNYGLTNVGGRSFTFGARYFF